MKSGTPERETAGASRGFSGLRCGGSGAGGVTVIARRDGSEKVRLCLRGESWPVKAPERLRVMPGVKE